MYAAWSFHCLPRLHPRNIVRKAGTGDRSSRPHCKPGSKPKRATRVSRRPRRAAICVAISRATSALGPMVSATTPRSDADRTRTDCAHRFRSDRRNANLGDRRAASTRRMSTKMFDVGNPLACRQSHQCHQAQRGRSNSGMPVSSRYGLFFVWTAQCPARCLSGMPV